MQQNGTPKAGLAVAAVFIVLEIAALSMLKSSSVLQNIWLNRFSHNVMALTWGGVSRFKDYTSLRHQNDILAGRNFELYKELSRYQDEERHARSQALLDSVPGSRRFSFIPAEVTAMGTNTRHNYIILNKGSQDGVTPNSAIITPHGVVGIVQIVDKRYSYGLSLLNDRIVVSARIGREGIVAPLSWDGKSTKSAVLKNIPFHHKVAEGDTVLTSGMSSLYPPDIPIGITMGSRIVDGASNVVDVDLFLDFAALRYVIIAENKDRETIEELAR